MESKEQMDARIARASERRAAATAKEPAQPIELDGSNRQLKKRVAALSNAIDALKAENKFQFREFSNKTELTMQTMSQILSFLGDVETRLEAMKAMGIRAGTFTEKQYEEVWDEIKGMRVKAETEIIASGDSVMVSFKGETATGKVVLREENFPMRVGSGTFIVEDYIIGKRVGEKVVKFKHRYPMTEGVEESLRGNEISFTAQIIKVKTKKEVKDEKTS